MSNYSKCSGSHTCELTIEESELRVKDYVLLRWSDEPVHSIVWNVFFANWFLLNALYNYRYSTTTNTVYNYYLKTDIEIKKYQWIFLTNWGEVINISYAVFSSFVVIGSRKMVDLYPHALHKFIAKYYQVQSACCFSVTVFYYLGNVVGSEVDPDLRTYKSINSHMLQSLITLVNISLMILIASTPLLASPIKIKSLLLTC